MKERLQYQIASLTSSDQDYCIERLYFPTETAEETEHWEAVAHRIIEIMTHDRGAPIRKESRYREISNNMTILTVVTETEENGEIKKDR